MADNHRYTFIRGKLVRFRVTATGARIIPHEVFENFRKDRKNVHDEYIKNLKSAKEVTSELQTVKRIKGTS